MGVQKLGQLIRELNVGHVLTSPDTLRGKIVAIDALPTIYQMLATIRDKRGYFLRDKKGRITSHLVGLFNRTIKLLELRIIPVFVFDGPPHPLKLQIIRERKEERMKWREEFLKAIEEGKREEAIKLGKRAMMATTDIILSAKELLILMGIPVIEAKHDAEAQAAFMCKRKDAHIAATRDWDIFIYGCPEAVLHFKLTITPFDVPKATLYRLDDILKALQISYEQFIDLAILLGTDFNPGGFEGIGPKTALKLIKLYGSLESILKSRRLKWKWDVPPERIREIFLHPPVNEKYHIEIREPNEEKLYEFLVEEHDFNKTRVRKRLRELYQAINALKMSRSLEYFLA